MSVVTRATERICVGAIFKVEAEPSYELTLQSSISLLLYSMLIKGIDVCDVEVISIFCDTPYMEALCE
jgi:hypothetical protein